MQNITNSLAMDPYNYKKKLPQINLRPNTSIFSLSYFSLHFSFLCFSLLINPRSKTSFSSVIRGENPRGPYRRRHYA